MRKQLSKDDYHGSRLRSLVYFSTNAYIRLYNLLVINRGSHLLES